MNNVILTGATGFIGKNVVQELIRNNKNVTILVRDAKKAKEIFEGVDVDILECPMQSYSELPNIVKRKYDTMYHFAWDGVSGDKQYDIDIQIGNLRNTIDLIKILPSIGCNRFIGAGSLHEIESSYEMKLDKVINNLGYMYKGSKISAHWMGKALAGSLNIDFFWPIIVNAYGEGEKSKRLINSIIRCMFNGEGMSVSAGEQLYDFLHISDVANAFYLIGERGVNGRNYVIGSGKPNHLKYYFETIENIFNSKYGTDIHLKYGEKKNNVVSLPADEFENVSLINDTGFEPKVSFEEGIQKTIDYIYNTEFATKLV